MNSVQVTSQTVDPTTDVPGILKRLVRTVAYTFYQPCHIAILNVLLRHIVVDEDSLSLLLKIDKKQLRSMILPLRSEKLIKLKILKEKIEDSCQYFSFTYYYINFHLYLNVIKYKLESMKRKIVHTEDSHRLRPNYTCGNCGKGFTDLDMSRLINMKTGELTCYLCYQPVHENEESKQQIMSRTLLAKFNQQFNYLYKLIDKCYSVEFDDKLIEPSVTKSHIERAIISRNSLDADIHELFQVNNAQNAKTKRLLSHNLYQQQLSVKFDEATQSIEGNNSLTNGGTNTSKQLPEWLKNSDIEISNDTNNKSLISNGKRSERISIFTPNLAMNTSIGINNQDIHENDDDIDRNNNKIDDIEEMLRMEMDEHSHVDESHKECDTQDDTKLTDNNDYYMNELIDGSQISDGIINNNLITKSHQNTQSINDNDFDDVNMYMMFGGKRVYFNDITNDMIDKMTDAERGNYTSLLSSFNPSLF